MSTTQWYIPFNGVNYGFEEELNDTYNLSTGFKGYRGFAGGLSGIADVDWFTTSLTKSENTKITFTSGNGQFGEWRVEIFNSQLKSVYSEVFRISNLYGPSSVEKYFSVSEAGSYYFKVTAWTQNFFRGDVYFVLFDTPNSPPFGFDHYLGVFEDSNASGRVDGIDQDGDNLTFSMLSGPTHGSATINSDGTFNYAPDANYVGDDSFRFSVTDGRGGSGTGRLFLTINPINDSPVALDQNQTVEEDKILSGSLQATDIDSTSLTYTVITQPNRGTVKLGDNGSYIYTPTKDANGSDSFTFKANDGELSSNTATVYIKISAINDAPVVTLALKDLSLPASSALDYTLPSNSFTDIDSSVLNYSAALASGSPLPSWLSFDPVTRTFSGKPGPTNVGSIDVRVTASDGSLEASDVYKITISDRPLATSYSPADGARSVPLGSNLAITFSSPIQLGSGAITLKTAAGKVVETFTDTNATVFGSTLTLNPSADLSIFTKYVVELGAGAVKDAAGTGNAADSRYDFQTATQDGLYHFFVVAFAAAPGATYMGQLAEAVNVGLPLNQIVDIFTTKKQFTDVYPTTLSNRELAAQLVNNIVKNSASTATKQAAIDDIDAALGIGWSRGKMLFQVFGNLASKPLSDPIWGNTAKQFQNQLAVARYFTEEMGVATENLATLRGVIANVTPDTDVSTPEKIVQIIGTIPPGG